MSAPAVVLVTRPGAAADCLKEALRSAGAVLAWIGEPEQLDPGQPPGTVVVLNLDPAIEADLARLSPLWSLPEVRVVFNDATVTQGLSGWDLKRWARHLVAKVFARDGHPEL
ncbi:MAG: chemotaxis protein, partial [Casimicrobiaceae bacterium]|nr:chemotaxis protein [Casimicrobiaceae bacterium]